MPPKRETAVSQNECKNPKQDMSKDKYHASADISVPDQGVTFDKTQALLFDINEDKFVNTMFARHLNRQVRRDAELNCDNYKKWKCQTSFDFGFTLLGDFINPCTNVQSKIMTENRIDLHKIIKDSGTYNYMACRIPVRSQSKVDVWAQELEGYWDTQLVEFLRYGFPLDFNRDSKLRCEEKNHNSAL